MLAERSVTELTRREPDRTTDHAMLVLQYLMAGISLVAAILLAGAH